MEWKLLLPSNSIIITKQKGNCILSSNNIIRSIIFTYGQNVKQQTYLILINNNIKITTNAYESRHGKT